MREESIHLSLSTARGCRNYDPTWKPYILSSTTNDFSCQQKTGILKQKLSQLVFCLFVFSSWINETNQKQLPLHVVLQDFEMRTLDSITHTFLQLSSSNDVYESLYWTLNVKCPYRNINFAQCREIKSIFFLSPVPFAWSSQFLLTCARFLPRDHNSHVTQYGWWNTKPYCSPGQALTPGRFLFLSLVIELRAWGKPGKFSITEQIPSLWKVGF